MAVPDPPKETSSSVRNNSIVSCAAPATTLTTLTVLNSIPLPSDLVPHPSSHNCSWQLDLPKILAPGARIPLIHQMWQHSLSLYTFGNRWPDLNWFSWEMTSPPSTVGFFYSSLGFWHEPDYPITTSPPWLDIGSCTNQNPVGCSLNGSGTHFSAAGPTSTHHPPTTVALIALLNLPNHGTAHKRPQYFGATTSGQGDGGHLQHSLLNHPPDLPHP